MAANSSSPQQPPPPISAPTPADEGNLKLRLLKQIRDHEVALEEMNCLRPDRAVYQRNMNIFFRKNVKSVIATEQKQLDLSKAQLEKLNSAQ